MYISNSDQSGDHFEVINTEKDGLQLAYIASGNDDKKLASFKKAKAPVFIATFRMFNHETGTPSVTKKFTVKKPKYAYVYHKEES